nr:CLAVATA3/ESR (CLE)-related protein 13 [Ipomoea batatas]
MRMRWCFSKTQQMSLALLSLLLLVLLQLKAPHYGADGSNGKSYRFNGGAAVMTALKSHRGSSSAHKDNQNLGGGDDDEIFGVDKRKVRTGPNPLHNR